MQDERDYESERDWTPEELAELTAGRGPEPSAGLKRRTIGALHERGLLREERAPALWLRPVLAAAAAVVFAVGALCGYLVGARRTAEEPRTASPAAPTAVASVDSIRTPPKSAKQVIWF